MPIVLRSALQRDAGKWNEIVEKDSQGSFFDRFEWCQALATASQHVKPIPLFLEESGKTVGIFPVCLIASMLYRSLESLPFSDYGGGPCFRKEEMFTNRGLLTEFVKSLVDYGFENGCSRISIRRAYFPGLIDDDMVKVPVITDQNTCSFVLSLREGIKEVQKRLDKCRRVSVREGEKRGIIVRQADNAADLKSYYELYLETMNRLRSAPFPYEFFQRVWDRFISRHEARILIAEYNKKPVAGVLHFFYKKVAYWSGNVSLEEYWNKRPTDLLVWRSIELAIADNLEVLDMGSTVNDPSSGHYFFKKTWGGEKRLLYNYTVLLRPYRWRLPKLANDLMNRLKNMSGLDLGAERWLIR